MKPEVQQAIQTIMQALGGAEAQAMGGGGGDKVVEIEVEPASTHLMEGEDDGKAACPECAAGTCDNPDHLDDSGRAALLNEMG